LPAPREERREVASRACDAVGSGAVFSLPIARVLAVASLAASGLLAPDVAAFERQWHLGAGVGVVKPDQGYPTGPALSLHAAYGLSDVFDARFELRSSLHEQNGRTALTQAALGLAYKLDIIEWVPYFGVRGGYYRFSSEPVAPLSNGGGLLGGFAGVDYAFSRSAAVGLEVDYDMLLPEGGAYAAVLRAEYRWGW
jgi:hypothetical protein